MPEVLVTCEICGADRTESGTTGIIRHVLTAHPDSWTAVLIGGALSGDVAAERTEKILAEIEALRHLQSGDAEFETAMSINDWVERIKGATVQAHQQARTEGMTRVQYETWIDIAAIAVARASVLAGILEDEAADAG